jgi:hypothetical protein
MQAGSFWAFAGVTAKGDATKPAAMIATAIFI